MWTGGRLPVSMPPPARSLVAQHGRSVVFIAVCVHDLTMDILWHNKAAKREHCRAGSSVKKDAYGHSEALAVTQARHTRQCLCCTSIGHLTHTYRGQRCLSQ